MDRKKRSIIVFSIGLGISLSGLVYAEVDFQAPMAQSLTGREHLLLGTDPHQKGAFLEVDASESHLRIQVSRTSALEYLEWIGMGAGLRFDAYRFVSDAGGDGVINIYKFGLDLESPFTSLPIRDVMPRQITLNIEGVGYEALIFVRKTRPENNRIVYFLESENENEPGSWKPVGSPVYLSREKLRNDLERVTFGVKSASLGQGFPRLRLHLRYEPVPTIFAHYMSDLNPGWSAMGFLALPIPAYFRLFHDRPHQMQPVPMGPSDYFQSTGGLHRDLPLLPPGFLFSTAIESAELEIRRARRAGIDGFAVNCLGGRTDFLETLFDAAVRLNQDGSDYPPFLITLSIDINVIPFEDREMLSAVSELISTWLAAGEQGERRSHLARRGGMPLVMGYQSHWIWINYLERLLELWERADGVDIGWSDDRLKWPESLGRPPETPRLPAAVTEEYRRRKQARIAELKAWEDPRGEKALREDYDFFRKKGLSSTEALAQARESLARRDIRTETVRRWARHPDSWTYIREAYRLLERVVGEKLFWQFDAIDIDDTSGNAEEALRIVGRDFPAVNLFLPKTGLVHLARRVIRDSGAEWGEPLHAQYVAYGQNEQNGLFLGNSHGGDGTGTFRRGWYHALGENLETGKKVADPRLSYASDNRSSLIQYTTWNDYVEHSHLAPSLQMRYALIELSRYFIHTWKTGEPLTTLGEQVFVFYRKYREMGESVSFPFQHAPTVHPIQVEVVAILREAAARLDLLREHPAEPGQFRPRAESRFLQKGFQVLTYLDGTESDLLEEGSMTARVTKESGEIISATGWEEITHRPFRQDFTLVGASSRCDELWEQDMPESGMVSFTYSEYGDVDEDGMPNWFEMLYFGQGWLELNDQTRADPDGDENRDGRSNLDHYREGTNPTYFAEPIPYHEDAQGKLEPFELDPHRRTRIQAEHFDRGGPGVAYHRDSFETMRSGGYRRTRYDMASHRRVDAHEEDGGDWMVAPLRDAEWMTYSVDAPAGCYAVSARVREGGGRILLDLNGNEVLNAVIENRGLWSTQALGMIEVTPEQAGRQVLRIRFDSPGYGLNWFQFEPCRRL